MKNLVRDTFGRLGLDVRRKRAGGWDPENLASLCDEPATIVDIGVGYGTLPLYEAFPHASLFLVEPLAEFESRIQEILRKREGRYALRAVGEKDTTLTLNVEPDNLQSSTFSRRSALTAGKGPVEERDVPVTTLDSLRREFSLKPPYGLKIDTEGHEDAVIRGAKEFLREARFVISEVSVGSRFENSYGFADFVLLMKESGFKLIDILEISRFRDRRIRFLDAVFIRG